MIRAVVFDLGEVLSSPPSLFPDLASRLGVEPDALAQRYWEGRADYDAGVPNAQYWGPILEGLGLEASPELVERAAVADATLWVDLRSTARQLLRDVRGSGVRVALLSNSPSVMESVSQSAPWRNDFHDVFISAVLGICKPEPEIYRLVTARLECEADEVAFIDDRPENVNAASAQGWRAHLWASDADSRIWLTSLGVL